MLICMRTTINLPDALAQEAKERAARDGRTFTSLVEEGLRRVLDSAAPSGRHVVRVFDAPPGARVLVDPTDRQAVTAILDEDLPTS